MWCDNGLSRCYWSTRWDGNCTCTKLPRVGCTFSNRASSSALSTFSSYSCWNSFSTNGLYDEVTGNCQGWSLWQWKRLKLPILIGGQTYHVSLHSTRWNNRANQPQTLKHKSVSVKRWHFLRYFQSVTMNFVFLFNILCKFCLFVAVFFLLWLFFSFAIRFPFVMIYNKNVFAGYRVPYM